MCLGHHTDSRGGGWFWLGNGWDCGLVGLLVGGFMGRVLTSMVDEFRVKAGKLEANVSCVNMWG